MKREGVDSISFIVKVAEECGLPLPNLSAPYRLPEIDMADFERRLKEFKEANPHAEAMIRADGTIEEVK